MNWDRDMELLVSEDDVGDPFKHVDFGFDDKNIPFPQIQLI